ncbi:MAG: hypothetical protein M1831_002637 [Alyxoria varia]|nr:MAG: hypothetical protein M1831_002637 [Alyxoria varia]
MSPLIGFKRGTNPLGFDTGGCNGADVYMNGKPDVSHHDRVMINGIAKAFRFQHKRSDDEPYDLVCVGFGPANLALAVALHDALDSARPPPGLESFYARPPKVLFLERQKQFIWHEGMLLPGTKMQITFIKDLATLRDPRSEFTFLNYLHSKDRLVHFTNLDTFLPQRIEYQDYMKWCASKFESLVQYGKNVVDVRPTNLSTKGPRPDGFAIRTASVGNDGEIETLRAKRVVMAIGGRPSVPPPLQIHHPQLIHSSQYAQLIPSALPNANQPYHIAVIGAGQSAAEVFMDLHSRYPNASTKMLIRTDALRPSDDSPFVNEIFNPDRVTPFYNTPDPHRHTAVNTDRSTNYSVVRPELLNQIYEHMYHQRLSLGSDEPTWKHRILKNTSVRSARPWENDGDGGKKLTLELSDSVTGADKGVMEFDAVIFATGYRRDAHEEILTPCWDLLEQPAPKPSSASNTNKITAEHDETRPNVEVTRDYKVKMREGAFAEGSEAGVWLQGCNEQTHGLSDTLLSILASRSGELVRSLFGDNEGIKNGGENGEKREMAREGDVKEANGF